MERIKVLFIESLDTIRNKEALAVLAQVENAVEVVAKKAKCDWGVKDELLPMIQLTHNLMPLFGLEEIRGWVDLVKRTPHEDYGLRVEQEDDSGVRI